MLRTLKSIYDKAKAQVKRENRFSNWFEITEGVLQGEILSPLLFILFISDFERFFRQRDQRGLSISGLSDVLMLMYADDTVILGYSIIDVKRKLKILADYCDLNGLTVNATKTKIVAFRKSGRIHADETNAFRYKREKVEVVTTYNNLGIIIARNTLGLPAAKAALVKVKLAISAVNSILARAKSDAWESKIKLFKSIVRPTLLYGVQVWGFGYFDVIELAQTNFFKQILQLPRNTPGYVLRLALGLDMLAVEALRLTWGWTDKIIKMNDNHLPKICLARLMDLSTSPSNTSRFNWVSRLIATLREGGINNVPEILQLQIWENKREELIDKYARALRQQDFDRYSRSAACQVLLP